MDWLPHNQFAIGAGADASVSKASVLLAELPLSAWTTVNDNFQVTAMGNQFELRHLSDRVQIISHSNAAVDIFEQVLELLDLDSDWLSWINPELALVPYEIWRQDDNGQAFVIRTARCRADAARMVRRLESSPHKQMYWIRPAIPNEV
ncbi:MAG: hypothetical protein K2W95_10910 [Candidatus Obscuribacterales bacterium]|nr:hypothetical protein [Candidatus Obscuribacterales bacterium]